MAKIIELNPVYSRYTGKKSDISALLSYETEVWYQGAFRKEKVIKTNTLIFERNTFYTGFIKRLLDNLEDVEYKPIDYKIKRSKNLKVEGKKFREYQKKAIKKVLRHNRGVVQATMAAGKTLIMGGIASLLQTKVLIVVPSVELLEQTIEKFREYFPDTAIGKIGSGEEVITDITVGVINSIYKNKKVLENNWGVVLIDEVHKVSSLTGMYAQFLNACTIPLRYGFTGTIDKNQEKAMAMEALVGPKIVEVKKKTTAKYLAKPKLILLLDRESKEFKRMPGKYLDLYKSAIVKNRYRNALIINEAKKWIEEDKTVLILVEKIEHGKLLLKMAEIAMPGVFCFLSGNTKGKIKKLEKKKLVAKKRKGVIATRIWGEGVDIETLGVAINAVGGESEKAVLQRLARVMRKAKDKEEGILVDVMDAENHRYFMEHSLKRVCYYSEMGWL